MEIKILGTRGNIKPSSPGHERHSGILIDGKIMIDLGESSYLDHEPEHILLTHLHPDHAYFLEKEENGKKVTAYGPEKYRAGKVEVKEIKKEIFLDSYRIIPVPTIHSKSAISQAYIIHRGEESILYTGDLVWIEKKHHHLFRGLDLVITDGSHIKKGGLVLHDDKTGQIYGHNGIPDLIYLFSRYTDNILFVHYGSWFFKQDAEKSKEMIREAGRQKGISAIPVEDGQTLETSELMARNHNEYQFAS